jgi:hypothetical protein
MIKGRLGLRWRGTALVALGVGIPVTYIVLSGGPEATKLDPALAKQTDGSGVRLLTPDENEAPPQRPPVRVPTPRPP